MVFTYNAVCDRAEDSSEDSSGRLFRAKDREWEVNMGSEHVSKKRLLQYEGRHETLKWSFREIPSVSWNWQELAGSAGPSVSLVSQFA